MDVTCGQMFIWECNIPYWFISLYAFQMAITLLLQSPWGCFDFIFMHQSCLNWFYFLCLSYAAVCERIDAASWNCHLKNLCWLKRTTGHWGKVFTLTHQIGCRTRRRCDLFWNICRKDTGWAPGPSSRHPNTCGHTPSVAELWGGKRGI